MFFLYHHRPCCIYVCFSYLSSMLAFILCNNTLVLLWRRDWVSAVFVPFFFLHNCHLSIIRLGLWVWCLDIHPLNLHLCHLAMFEKKRIVAVPRHQAMHNWFNGATTFYCCCNWQYSAYRLSMAKKTSLFAHFIVCFINHLKQIKIKGKL